MQMDYFEGENSQIMNDLVLCPFQQYFSHIGTMGG